MSGLSLIGAVIGYFLIGGAGAFFAWVFRVLDDQTTEAQVTGYTTLGLVWPIVLVLSLAWLVVKAVPTFTTGARDLYTVFAARRSARRSKLNVPTNAPLPVARILRK